MKLRFDDRPWLLLCEGESDKRFFDRLIEARGIPQEFQVKFPDRGGGAGGRSEFGPWLALMQKTAPGFENIEAILVVSDNDQNPAASFQEVGASLTMSDGFPVPNAEWTVAKSPGYPALVVRMVPTGAVGNLETLCLEAAFHKWPDIQAPVDTFTASVAANAWHIGKRSKMRLQSIIAATCEARPEAGFVGHWREAVVYHLPLDHGVFDGIEADLRAFPGLIAAA